MKFKIDVTQSHIDNGVRSFPCLCPIALAIIDVTKSNWVSVGTATAGFKFEDRTVNALLPNVACRFVSNFDAGRNVKPFQFEIEAESWNEIHGKS